MYFVQQRRQAWFGKSCVILVKCPWISFHFKQLQLEQFLIFQWRRGWFCKSWLILAKWPGSPTHRALHQPFSEKKKIIERSILSLRTSTQWETGGFPSALISIYGPTFHFSFLFGGNPNLLTKICGLNYFLFDNLSFCYPALYWIFTPISSLFLSKLCWVEQSNSSILAEWKALLFCESFGVGCLQKLK